MRVWIRLKMLLREWQGKVFKVKGLRLLWLVLSSRDREATMAVEIDQKDALNVGKRDISRDNALVKEVITTFQGEEGEVEVDHLMIEEVIPMIGEVPLMIEDSAIKDRTMIEEETDLDPNRNHTPQ